MSLLKVNTVQTDTLKSIAGVNRNSVLQVVSKEVTTDTTSTSVSFADATDMFLAITPTSSTSKILVMFNVKSTGIRASSAHLWAFQILRDSTIVYFPGTNNGTGNLDAAYSLTGVTNISYISRTDLLSFVDSPSTTNEITYKLQFCNYVSTSTSSVIINQSGRTSTITLMEIAQ
jgi:hypothetical protein